MRIVEYHGEGVIDHSGFRRADSDLQGYVDTCRLGVVHPPAGEVPRGPHVFYMVATRPLDLSAVAPGTPIVFDPAFDLPAFSRFAPWSKVGEQIAEEERRR